MADDLTLPIRTTGARDTVRDLDKLADALTEAGRRAGGAGRDLSGAARDFDRAATQARQAARDVDHLGRALDRLHNKRVQVKVDIDQSHLSRLGSRIAAVGGRAGRGIGGALSGGARAFGNLPWWAQLGILGLPILGGAGGAVGLLGAGGLGLAGGILGAIKDPKVGAAFKALRDKFLDIDTTDMAKAVEDAQKDLDRARKSGNRQEINEAKAELVKAQAELQNALKFNAKNISLPDLAKPFVEPLTKVADRWGQAWERIQPSIQAMMTGMAPVLAQLGEGLAGLVERLMPGLERGMAASKPLFDTLAEHMPEIGQALGQFFDQLAQHGPAINLFLDRMLSALEQGIVVTGWLFGQMAELFARIDAVISAIMRLFGLGRQESVFVSVAPGKVGAAAGAALGAITQGTGTRRALQHGGLLFPGDTAVVGEAGPEKVTMFGGGGYVTPITPRGGGDDVIGTLRVVHERPTGEHIRTELVTLRRRRGYTSFDKMVPA